MIITGVYKGKEVILEVYRDMKEIKSIQGFRSYVSVNNRSYLDGSTISLDDAKEVLMEMKLFESSFDSINKINAE